MTDDTDKTLRIVGVSVLIDPNSNEQAFVEMLQRELSTLDCFGSAIEFGTVDLYEHIAHSGQLESREGEEGGDSE